MKFESKLPAEFWYVNFSSSAVELLLSVALLTHCVLMMHIFITLTGVVIGSFNGLMLCMYVWNKKLRAWCHQAITWTKIDLSLMKFSGINLRSISLEIFKISIISICCKITHIRITGISLMWQLNLLWQPTQWPYRAWQITDQLNLLWQPTQPGKLLWNWFQQGQYYGGDKGILWHYSGINHVEWVHTDSRWTYYAGAMAFHAQASKISSCWPF